MELPSRTAGTPSRTAFREGVATPAHPAPTEAVHEAGPSLRPCSVCGENFTPSRSAKTCSGRCRMLASRTRRVDDLVSKLELAGRALVHAEHALCDARVGLDELRALASSGSSK